MAEVYRHLRPNVRIRDFANQRINELKREIEKAQAEKEMWERIKDNTNPCQTCDGYGETRVILDQDSSRLESCPACNGTGDKQ